MEKFLKYSYDDILMLHSHTGGRAMSGGADYQARVSAWWCCHILLQSRFSDRYSLDDSSYPERIYCETNDFVDDIRIEFNDDVKIYAQCKRRISFSELPESDWADVLTQFYHQFFKDTEEENDFRLVLHIDRYNNYWRIFSDILNRYRQYTENVDIESIFQNRNEERILGVFNNIINALREAGLSEIINIKNRLLKKIYIENLTLQDESETFSLILNNLSNNLLHNPDQSRSVWAYIKEKTDTLHATAGTTNRNELRDMLNRRGIELKFSLNFRNDINRLNSFSQETISQEIEYGAVIKIGDDSFSIPRQVLQDMYDSEESFLVIGEAGVGKTGVLLSLSNELMQRGKYVWYWSVSSVWAESLIGLQTLLGLEYSWKDIFSEAATSRDVVLIVDGLDALKDLDVKRAYINLIMTAIKSGIQVIASIRSFDLRYSVEFRELFSNTGEPLSIRFYDEEFNSVNHFHIGNLVEEELIQVRGHFSEIDTVFDSVPSLLPILKNLFSLSLLCNLISDENIIRELSETYTQAQLFNLYWEQRVNSSEFRVQITNSLIEQINEIVEHNRLQAFNPGWSDEIHNYLCSTGIVREYSHGSLPIPGWVEFSHNLIFDYCAELLFIRQKLVPSHDILIRDVQTNETWTLFLRPSLRLFYFRLFKDDPAQFWYILLNLESLNAPLIQKYLAYLTIVENTFIVDDLHQILEGLSNQSQLDEWVNILKGVINAAVHSVLPKYFKNGSGDWWLSFSYELIQSSNEVIREYSKRILFVASDNHEFLSEECLSFLNRSSRHLLEYYWQMQQHENPLTRLPIKMICESISSHCSESIETLSQLLTDDELRRSGYNQAYELTRNIKEIWRADPSFVITVYDHYTSYKEHDETNTPMNFSQILLLISTKSQQYNSGFYNLTQGFSEFLLEYPIEATKVLCKSVKNYLTIDHVLDRINNFHWKGQKCTIIYDISHIWDFNDNTHREEINMLRNWEQYLVELPSKDEAEEIYESLEHIVITENQLAVIWRRLLRAGSKNPEFYANILYDLLTINRVLIQPELRETIQECIEAFTPLLNGNNLHDIISTIMRITIDDAVIADPIRIAELTRNIKLDYLICIPQEYQSVEVTEYLEEYSQHITQREKRERPFAQFTSLSPDEIHRLEGINIDSSHYRELTDLSAFIENIKNDDITQENYKRILQRVYDVESRLTELEEEMEPELYALLKNKLCNGFSKIACSNIVINPDEIHVLFERFNSELHAFQMTPTANELASFDNNQSYWSSNDYYASKGIVALSLKMPELSDEVKEALRYIALHPRPVNRVNLGYYLWRLIEIWPEFVWNTLERWTSELATQPGLIGVLKLTLFSNHSWFWILKRNDEERAISFISQLRSSAHTRQADVIENLCGKILTVLYYKYNETWTERELINIIQNFRDRINEVEGILDISLNIIFPRATLDFENLSLLQKAQRFLVEILQKCYQNISAEGLEILEENINFIQKIRTLYSRTTTEFRLSAEKQSEYWIRTDGSNLIIESWWAITESILDQLLQYPHPSIIYDVIQGLQSLIVPDIVKSINWLSKFTVSGASMGISNEILIVDKTMSILEQIVTEHSNLIILNPNFKCDFLNILEVFLVNGWPKAIQLVMNLESIYR